LKGETSSGLLQACLFPGLEEEIVVYQAQRLVERNVRRCVAGGLPGAFYLKKVLARGGIEESVGRDDQDLREKLLSLCRPELENVLFGWTIATTASGAYRHECCLWHIKGGAYGRLSSGLHPRAPDEAAWAACPECGSPG
jgi:hypothetical protein